MLANASGSGLTVDTSTMRGNGWSVLSRCSDRNAREILGTFDRFAAEVAAFLAGEAAREEWVPFAAETTRGRAGEFPARSV